MPNINSIITIHYFAWDFANKLEKIGDEVNHTLYIIKDGVASLATNSPVEVDSTNAPGVYALELTAAENNAESIAIRGKSSTSDVELLAPFWSNNVDINQIEGQVLSGKTGINLDTFFQNSGSTTVKVIDNVGEASVAGDPKVGACLDYGDMLVLSSPQDGSYCAVLIGGTVGDQCRAIIEQVDKVDATSQYTRLCNKIYKISFYTYDETEDWDSTNNPNSTVEAFIHLGINKSLTGVTSDSNWMADLDGGNAIFTTYVATSISNLENGSGTDESTINIDLTGEGPLWHQSLTYDLIAISSAETSGLQELYVGAGDVSADAKNTPLASDVSTTGSVDITFSFNTGGGEDSLQYGFDLIYNTLLGSIGGESAGGTPADPTLSSYDGLITGADLSSGGEAATLTITGDDQYVAVSYRLVGNQTDAWYIPGTVQQDEFYIPAGGE